MQMRERAFPIIVLINKLALLILLGLGSTLSHARPAYLQWLDGQAIILFV